MFSASFMTSVLFGTVSTLTYFFLYTKYKGHGTLSSYKVICPVRRTLSSYRNNIENAKSSENLKFHCFFVLVFIKKYCIFRSSKRKSRFLVFLSASHSLVFNLVFNHRLNVIVGKVFVILSHLAKPCASDERAN